MHVDFVLMMTFITHETYMYVIYVFIRGEIWLWGERLLYEEGEILL